MRKGKRREALFYEKASYQTVIDSSQIVAMSIDICALYVFEFEIFEMSSKRETKRKMSLHGLF